MDPSEYENIARLEAQHWWYRGMAQISLALLPPLAPAAGHSLKILDAGCGPGGMLPRLAALGVPVGLDMHPLALSFAHQQAASTPLLRASITQLPIKNEHFDLIISLDVLYHRAVADDTVALFEFWRVLKPGGALLIRVPALEALRGAHDVVVHTQRRYTKAGLGDKLCACGFQIKRLTYANTILLPLIFIRRKLQPATRAATSSDVELPGDLVNRLLELVLNLERLWLIHANLPIGVSLFALAFKPGFTAT